MSRQMGLLVLSWLLLVTPVVAQDQPAATLSPAEILEQINVVATEAKEAVAVAEAVADDAAVAADMAFNLLGLFEALSLAVTVGGVVLTAFGFSRFNSAQRELESTRKEVLDEIQNQRRQFEREVLEREAVIKTLQERLEQEAKQEREQTSNALLASALIPIAERQYQFSDYSGALKTYQRALGLDPRNPVVHQKLAYVYTQSGDLDQAKYHYEEAIRREPDFAPAVAGLGFVYRRLGESAEKRIASAETDEEKRQRRLQAAELLTQAEQLLVKALQASPRLVDDDGESWWGVLGGLYKRRNEIDRAIEAYREATIVTPESSYGYGNLALLYLKQQNQEKMLETYRRVEQIASKEALEQGNFWGYSDFIVSSYAIGKTQQAADALPTAIAIAPMNSPYMLDGLTQTLRELTQVLDAEAVEPIEEAIRILEDEMARRNVELTAQDEEDLLGDVTE